MNKNKKSKFINNLSFAFLAQFISLILSVIMSLVVPKILGVEEYSYWQLFIFYSNYMGFFHFGLNDGIYLKYGGMEYKNLDKRLIGSQFWLGALFQSIIAIGIGCFALFYVVEEQRIFILIMTAFYLVLYNLSLYLGFIFQATNETKIFSISVIIDKIIYLISIFILIIFKVKKFEIFVLMFLISKLIAFIYCIFKGKDIVFAKIIPFRKASKEMISNMKIGINLTLSNIAGMIILGSGRFMVDKTWGIESFGKFSFAISLTSFFLMFISQVSMVLFPMLRQLDKEKVRVYYTNIKSLLGILLPIVFLLYLPMKYILGLWLPQYEDSLVYLSLLLPLCIFDGKMQMLCTTYFKVCRKEKLLLFVNVITMLLSILLSIIGAYVIKSIYFIVISMVVSVGFRSIVSEILLGKLMDDKVIKEISVEVIFVIIFMYSSWYLNGIESFTILFITYLINLIINKKKVKEIIKFSLKFIN